MNATNDRSTIDRTATAYRAPRKSGWAADLAIVRDICLERSRARFLAARWLKLQEIAADSAGRALADATSAELRVIIRRYAGLLLELGESPANARSLVDELAAEVASHQYTDSDARADFRAELVEWVGGVSPARAPLARRTQRAD
jgi:hypothetical protein